MYYAQENLNGSKAGSSSSSTYEISSIDGLENSAGTLANYNQQISNNIASLKYVMNAVQENWENSDGQDINSIMTNLNDAIKSLSEEIQPVIATYVKSLNQIVTETRATQSRTF